MRRGVAATICAAALPVGAAVAEEGYRIATGAPDGNYYALGGAICALANRYADGAPPCRNLPTAGSAENLVALRRGEAGFALVQGDVARAALDEAEAEGPADLRGVMTLQTEMLTILTRRDGGIAALADLAGRKVSLGPEGSGHRATMQQVLSYGGWAVEGVPDPAGDAGTGGEHPTGDGDKAVGEAEQSAAAAGDADASAQGGPADGVPRIAALCDGRIAAAGFVFSSPSGVIDDALSRCPLAVLPISRDEVAALVPADGPYRPATIPSGTYETVTSDVPTLGMPVLLVTTADAPTARVEALLSRVMKDLDLLRASGPSLAGLTPEAMATPPEGIPLHGAAALYYEVTGFTAVLQAE
ncbi:TAXI family TRAP transporter solute-binding subunit [Mesobaculum littorinae]|nr:TAXI family TRAP transporter solute-binding subunit [Mesobaculum littorinae]